MQYDFLINKVLDRLSNAELSILLELLSNLDKKQQ